MRGFYEYSQDMGFVATSWSFPAGAALDPPGKEGLAHIVAEMALRGTRQMGREKLAQELEFLGCSPSVDVGVESAHFGFECPTRYLERLAGLLQQVFLEPAFEASELEKLRRQLLGEIADLRDSDGAAASLFFGQALYAGDPYGHPMRGFVKSVQSITTEDIARFRAEYYATHRLLLGVAGACSEAESRQHLEGLLHRLPEGGGAELPPVKGSAVEGHDVVLVTREERTQAQVIIGQLAIAGNDASLIPLRLAVLGFGGTFTAPLVREIREKRGWSYGVSAALMAGRRSGNFKMRFAPKNSDVVPAIRLSLELLEQLVEQGPDEANLEFSKRFIVQQYPFMVETPLSRLDQRLHIAATGKPDNYLATFCEQVLSATREQSCEALRRVIRPGRQTIVVLGDESLAEPLATLPGVGRFRMVPVEWDADLPEEGVVR